MVPDPEIFDLIQFQYAGFWMRFKAMMLDLIVLGLPFLILRVAGIKSGSIPGQLLAILIVWMYYAISESSPWQATFGKRMFGLKVTDTRGGRISFSQATGRWWARQISALTLGIGYLMCIWTKRHQTLHDKMSKCIVVKSVRRWQA